MTSWKMSSIVKCICCPFMYCCKCLKPKTKRSPSSPRRQIPKLEVKSIDKTTKDWENRDELAFPEQIKDRNLTKEYKIPNDYTTIQDCLRDQGLEQKEEIGSGGFAKVYKMIDIKERTVLAAKRIQTGEFFRNPRSFENLKAELFIMIRAKKHENIVHVIKHFLITDFRLQKEFCFILMEFANGGTILTKMTTTDPNRPTVRVANRLPEKTAKEYMRQIANGLTYLHSVKVAHKDLKLNNLLVFVKPDGNETIKITDFGLSRIRYDDKHGVVIKEYAGSGTVQFMSPQILRLHIYDQFGVKVDKLHTYDPFRADCWSLGVCLYIMIIADFPFPFGQQTEEDLTLSYRQMKQRKYELSVETKSTYSESCLDLISELLEPNPDKRLTAQIVLRHKWVIQNQ